MITLPIELFLKLCCPFGQACFWEHPELLPILEQHPDYGKLFHVEHTTAAKGPYVLWYPMSAWIEEQTRDAEINRLVALQYPAKESSKQSLAIQTLEMQITVAKEKGDNEMTKILEMALQQIKDI